MSWIISSIYAAYLLISVFIAAPAFAITISSFPLFNSPAGKIATALSLSWIFGGYIFLKLWDVRRTTRIMNKVRIATPDNFITAIALMSPHRLQYFSMSPTTRSIIIVDIKKNITLCESIDFIQRWEIFENNEKHFITISFNDFNYSSLTIRIGKNYLEDMKAKIRFALNY